MSPHEAIRLAKVGQMHPKELLEHLVAGKVAIPLEFASAFGDHDPDSLFYRHIEMRWTLRAMPEQHGIALWSAAGLAKYKKDVLGWE